MTYPSDWEQSLRKDDGSARDVNFEERLSPVAVSSLVDAIGKEWVFQSATDSEGVAVHVDDFRRLVGTGRGGISSLWVGGHAVRRLQCYIFWSPEEAVFCELTFFPDDVTEAFNMAGFIGLLRTLKDAAASTELYVRYENASWRHGEVSASSGVILSHRCLARYGG